jgi:hypothetical protein
MRLIFKPLDSSNLPILAEAIPLPRLDTTPPVTKIYLDIRRALRDFSIFPEKIGNLNVLNKM